MDDRKRAGVAQEGIVDRRFRHGRPTAPSVRSPSLAEGLAQPWSSARVFTRQGSALVNRSWSPGVSGEAPSCTSPRSCSLALRRAGGTGAGAFIGPAGPSSAAFAGANPATNGPIHRGPGNERAVFTTAVNRVERQEASAPGATRAIGFCTTSPLTPHG